MPGVASAIWKNNLLCVKIEVTVHHLQQKGNHVDMIAGYDCLLLKRLRCTDRFIERRVLERDKRGKY